ncbi:hypothetical protein DITRI_Ditri06bG0077200 [Diplodiscus trichospermus]
MATSSVFSSSFLVPSKPLTIQRQNRHRNTTSFRNRATFKVQAAKLPAGVLAWFVFPFSFHGFFSLLNNSRFLFTRKFVSGKKIQCFR